MEDNGMETATMMKKKAEEQAQRMVKYRKERKVKIRQMQQTLTMLEYTKEQIILRMEAMGRQLPSHKNPATSALSWKEIAKALQDDTRDSEHRRRDLQAQLERHTRLLRDMQLWVESNTPLETSILDPATPTWRNVTLLANPDSRRLGKEWILQHMFHHTDRIFYDHGLPPLDSPEEIPLEFNVQFTDAATFTAVFRSQWSHEASLDYAIGHFYMSLLPVQAYIVHYTPALPLVLTEIDARTRQFALATPRGEFINILCGEFRTAERCVFVVQQIQDDEAIPTSLAHRQRRRMLWHDIHQLPGGIIKRRIVSLHSQAVDAHGRSDLREDALDYAISLDGCPDQLHESRFVQSFRIKLAWQLEMVAAQAEAVLAERRRCGDDN
ncbi:Aste57867_8643 [Aphanomyces stellatus]|uniref:Aste57867_8643 protein n=1 Tax=Aphanomyces stellatus TaxID=120398 RepID=A0A485KKY5_9STRA|nr:hypothetical protein As57867_008609 [Aphanomyces stellatus]VFT85529.1 Aste57867_8643 [Aphanomyces stellatus]